MMFWENLKVHYLLAPAPGIIQLENHQVCVVPLEAIPINYCLETYNKGMWLKVDLSCPEGYKAKHYPYLHSSIDWPIPEEFDSKKDYVIFIFEDGNVDLCIENNADLIPISKIHITTYAMVRLDKIKCS